MRTAILRGFLRAWGKRGRFVKCGSGSTMRVSGWFVNRRISPTCLPLVLSVLTAIIWVEVGVARILMICRSSPSRAASAAALLPAEPVVGPVPVELPRLEMGP